MIYSVRLDYDSTMGEVGRVLRAVDHALENRGTVWASPEDAIEERVDSGYEPARGYALVDIEATDRDAAHAQVIGAIDQADPEHDVIVGGDVALRPITEHATL